MVKGIMRVAIKVFASIITTTENMVELLRTGDLVTLVVEREFENKAPWEWQTTGWFYPACGLDTQFVFKR